MWTKYLIQFANIFSLAIGTSAIVPLSSQPLAGNNKSKLGFWGRANLYKETYRPSVNILPFDLIN